MEKMKQCNTQSILFVVLGETTHELALAREILNDTEICSSVYLKKNETAVEQAFIAALSGYPGCRMVVITVSGNGTMLQDAMVLAQLTKKRGLLAVVETPRCGRTATNYLTEQSMSMEELLAHTDCVLLATDEEFYLDVQRFQQYLTTVLDGNDFIYLEFDDISAVLKNSGFAYLSMASVTGADTNERMASMADMDILPKEILAKAKGVIMHIAAPEDIDLEDVEAVANQVQSHTHSDGVLIFGAGFDSDLHHEIQVSVLAAGIVG